jgi:hypothetical protein
MHSSKSCQLQDDAIKITWCNCDLCSAVGPRSILVIKNQHEYQLELSAQCCKPIAGDEFLSLRGPPRPLRSQIRR